MSRQLLERARTLPGIEAVAHTNSVPLNPSATVAIFVAGFDSTRHLGRFNYRTVTPEYFATLGMRIVRGRGLNDGDRSLRNVAVISESMARALWPRGNALGNCFRLSEETMPCTTVVGITGDVMQSLPIDEAHEFYIPFEHDYAESVAERVGRGTLEGMTYVVVRTSARAAERVEDVSQALRPLLPPDAVLEVRPLQNSVDIYARPWRLGATMLVLLGLLALTVAAVGLHGLISYNVAQRMHELGVRVALGARRGDLIRLVLGQVGSLVVIGLATGIVTALFLGRWFEPLLFQQSTRDPQAFAGVAALLAIVAVLASFRPALRAAAADPNGPLRAE